MLTMQDSTNVNALLPGADVYAGYIGGSWPTYQAIKARFPNATVLSIAVASYIDADVLDIENGDAPPTLAPVWVKRQLARGIVKPILYASQSVMPAVLVALTANGISRDQVRLWTAHYTTQHICAPDTCKANGFTADATQWTDKGPGGENIDRSVLNDNFFGPAPVVPREDDMIIYWHEPISGSIYAYGAAGLRHIGALENGQATKLINDGHAARYDVDAGTVNEVLGALAAK